MSRSILGLLTVKQLTLNKRLRAQRLEKLELHLAATAECARDGTCLSGRQ